MHVRGVIDQLLFESTDRRIRVAGDQLSLELSDRARKTCW